MHTVNLSPRLPQRDLRPFTRITVHCGKGNDQALGGLLHTGSELTLIPGDSKHRCGPVKSRGLWRSGGGQWSFSSDLSHSGPSGSSNAPCGYFPSAGNHKWNTHTQQLAESPRRFPDLQNEGNYGGKAKWKLLKLSLCREIVNQKQYCIPGRTEEITATIKDLKDAGVVIPTTYHSTHLFVLCRRQTDLGE